MSLAVMACSVMNSVIKASNLKFIGKPVQLTAFLMLVLLFLLAPRLSSASQINDLYQVEVLVESQSSSERNRAVSRAMSEVLVKVTGQRQTVSNPAIKACAKKGYQLSSGLQLSTG